MQTKLSHLNQASSFDCSDMVEAGTFGRPSAKPSTAAGRGALRRLVFSLR